MLVFSECGSYLHLLKCLFTGIMVYKAESGARVLEERVKLEFLSHNYFKPYFPYYGKVIIFYFFSFPEDVFI